MKPKLPQIYLKPGGMYLATEPTVVSTVLGSCVSVTMFHPQRRIGAICHGLLPVCRENGICNCITECENGLKNMKCSLRIMFEQFKELGIAPRELEVKVFGGAEMISATQDDTTRQSVGSKNTAITLRLLEEARVTVKSSDLGGSNGRKIYFNSYTGEVLLKRMRKKLVHELSG